mgnify:CR=1 FL=1
MEGIGTLILICFAITFGPPVLFFIVGLVRHIKKDLQAAKVFYILAAVWLIVGGGTCASIWADA